MYVCVCVCVCVSVSVCDSYILIFTFANRWSNLPNDVHEKEDWKSCEFGFPVA